MISARGVDGGWTRPKSPFPPRLLTRSAGLRSCRLKPRSTGLWLIPRSTLGRSKPGPRSKPETVLRLGSPNRCQPEEERPSQPWEPDRSIPSACRLGLPPAGRPKLRHPPDRSVLRSAALKVSKPLEGGSARRHPLARSPAGPATERSPRRRHPAMFSRPAVAPLRSGILALPPGIPNVLLAMRSTPLR